MTTVYNVMIDSLCMAIDIKCVNGAAAAQPDDREALPPSPNVASSASLVLMQGASARTVREHELGPDSVSAPDRLSAADHTQPETAHRELVDRASASTKHYILVR